MRCHSSLIGHEEAAASRCRARYVWAAQRNTMRLPFYLPVRNFIPDAIFGNNKWGTRVSPESARLFSRRREARTLKE